jgi:hypothetical protein
MKTFKHLIASAALFCAALPAFAQHTNTGYFIDGYMYRHEINPAIGNAQNYISLPALGNFNLGLKGSLNLEDYIYNINGKTTTFLNPAVNAGEFLSNIDDENKLNFDTKIEILSAGFKAFGGYNTFGINVRSNIHTMLPKTLFQFAKEGISNKHYDISNFDINATAYAELALGHSRNINDQWRVGANLKVLFGLGNVEAKFNKAQVNLGNDEWTAVTNAEINASVKGLTYLTEISENTGKPYVNDVDIDGFGLNGMGLGIDLGAEFKLNDSWKFGAALLDLGFISWNNNMVATTNVDTTFTTNDYKFSFDDNDANNFDDEIDRLADGLVGLYELDNAGDHGKRTTALATTLNLAAEYTLPAYDKLKFGLMNTTRFQGDYTWTDFRLSANVAPLDFFSAGVNVAAGTYGCAFGWMVNFHPSGLNLFIAMDQTIGKVTKEFVPLSSKASLNFGLNVPF